MLSLHYSKLMLYQLPVGLYESVRGIIQCEWVWSYMYNNVSGRGLKGVHAKLPLQMLSHWIMGVV